MTTVEPILEGLVPRSDADPDWGRVLADAGRRRKRRLLGASLLLAAVMAAVSVTALEASRPARANPIVLATWRVMGAKHGVIRIVHVTSRGVAWRAWIGTDRPAAIREVLSGGMTYELTPCGIVAFDPARKTVSVTRAGYDFADVLFHEDPVVRFDDAYRRGVVRYRGRALDGAVPVYVLVTSEHGFTVTYSVRRSNYTPLEIVSRGPNGTTFRWRYSQYEELPRDAGNEHLLHVGHPRGVRITVSGRLHSGVCAAFDRRYTASR
jgi:hypothetical protein